MRCVARHSNRKVSPVDSQVGSTLIEYIVLMAFLTVVIMVAIPDLSGAFSVFGSGRATPQDDACSDGKGGTSESWGKLTGPKTCPQNKIDGDRSHGDAGDTTEDSGNSVENPWIEQ